MSVFAAPGGPPENLPADHPTLERVLHWAWAEGTDIVDVVVQDEFTHDVLVPHGATVLVYDTT